MKTATLLLALLLAVPGTAATPPAYVPARAFHVLPSTHNQESGYFSLCEGLDGLVYVGTSKYGENAYLVELDPRSGQQRIVLDTNKTCGLTARGFAAQAKLHTRNFVGPSGTIYVGSKQGYRFDKDDTSEYAGGFVMSYDPRTGQTKNLGMPMKGQGVADVVADEQRGLLYVVTCEDYHWMIGDLDGKSYRDLGPLQARYGTTLLGPGGIASIVTKDFQLAQYDPATKKVTTRPILIAGQRWSPDPTDGSIPTWVLSPDGKSAYLILMSDPTLLEIDLAPGDGPVRAISHGKLLDGPKPDSRCALAMHPDGKLYAVVRIDNTTGFGSGHLHHLVRFDPATKRSEDLGILTVSNPDYFDFEGQGGKKPPHSHGFHRLPDGTLTPLHHHMALIAAADGTLYITIIYPFTVLKVDAYKLPAKAAVSPAERSLDRSLAALDRAAENLPQLTKLAETIADRHLAGGLIGFADESQPVAMELWGRSGGIMHVGFTRPWKKERTDAEIKNDVAWAFFEGTPRPPDLDKLRELRKRGCFLVGFGPKGAGGMDAAAGGGVCDAWIDTAVPGTRADDVRQPMLSNAVHGWALTAEVVAALTRRGKMPVMWKSFAYDDGRAWMDRYYQKTAFHDDLKVPAIPPGDLARAFLRQIRHPLERLRRHAPLGASLSRAADLVRAERSAGRQTIVAWQGHMPQAYAGRGADDKPWAIAHELHPFLADQRDRFRKSAPDGALVLHLGYHGLDPAGADLFREKRQRLIHLGGAHPDPAWHPPSGAAAGLADRLLLTIDLAFAFGDACTSVEGYPLRILPPSGIAQLAAYDAICAEVGR